MSTKTIYICDYCEKEFKTVYAGGKTPDFVYDWYEQPPVHYRLTDTRGDMYDFCSKPCSISWLNGEK